MIKDSGKRKEFKSGAVRDVAEGKGRFDLMPIGEMAKLFTDTRLRDGLNAIDVFMCADQKCECKSAFLRPAVFHLGEYLFNSVPNALAEVSIHMEEGMLKYGENNWRKGIPVHCFIDSAIRHLMKHLAGFIDECHDRACLWNLICACWTLENKPELDDVDHKGYVGNSNGK